MTSAVIARRRVAWVLAAAALAVFYVHVTAKHFYCTIQRGGIGEKKAEALAQQFNEGFWNKEFTVLTYRPDLSAENKE